MNQKNSRRDFLKQSLALSSGLMIGFSPGHAGKLRNTASGQHEITSFIRIDTNGLITLVNPSPDMGQGSAQAIPTLIAEELEVDLDQVKIISSDGDAKYGTQISGGSGSVVRAWEPLRRAGAAAREMLIKAAAERWKTGIENCKAEKGEVINKITNEKLSYGQLVTTASQYAVPQNPSLKSVADFRLIGKVTKRPDVIDRVTGKAVYGMDVNIEGMVYACILHSPTLKANVKIINDTKARSIQGVLNVLKCERPMPYGKLEAVAVIATNFWAGLQGRKALQVTWDSVDGQIDSDDYINRMQLNTKETVTAQAETGNFDQHYARAGQKFESVYESNFLAHAPMEPENVVVHVKSDGTAEVWIPYQSPSWVKEGVAKYLDISPEKVKVNITLLGGSFGRKSYTDFLLEACYLSKEIQKPVKLIWSREDDLTQGPYRPAMLSHLQGIIDENKIGGFYHHAIGETFNGQTHGKLKPGETDEEVCGEIGFQNSKYAFQNIKISHTRVTTDIPIMWWRSVWGSNFSWSQECFIDEMAHRIKKDPLQVRMDNLQDERYRNVLKTLAEKSAYFDELPPGMAHGIAMWKSFGSISAACVTVIKRQKIEIKKVVSVLDCGLYINADTVKAQMEGSIVMGLSAATKEAITFTNGRCNQTNFHQYPILRLNEVPEIETHIIANGSSPGGVGEPALPPIAPALGNAVFNLTGKRIRKLPINLNAI
jgi:isoquinoline 1-oxidoreductase beta subunit